MSWSVSIADVDPLRRSARVWVWEDRAEYGTSCLDPHGVVHRLAQDVEPDPSWAWEFPNEVLGPLYAVLGKHLGAVENPQRLRKDYDAERARVDRLTDAVIGLAVRHGG
jgi:hypothetical protein